MTVGPDAILFNNLIGEDHDPESSYLAMTVPAGIALPPELSMVVVASISDRYAETDFEDQVA